MISPEHLRSIPLFDCFDDAYLEDVCVMTADVVLPAGEYLFFEGDPAAFYILLEGTVELSHLVVRRQHVLGTYKACDFFGEVPLLLGSKALCDAIALTRVRTAKIDQQAFRQFLSHSEKCTAALMQSLMDRVGHAGERIEQVPVPKIVLVGETRETAAAELRQFLTSVRTPYQWIDRTVRPQPAKQLLGETTAVPAIFIDGQLRAVAPTLRDVACLLDLPTVPKLQTYDVIIVGAGPAGLAAAVYGSSEGLSVIVLDQKAPGGQAGSSSRIENYLGFPGGISGDQLIERALRQAGRFGAEIVVTRRATQLQEDAPGLRITLEDGAQVSARAVVLSIGVDWRRLAAKDIDRYIGSGVTYGADRSEAPFVVGKIIFIVGGGNSAGQAAMFFSNYAAQVTLLVRGDSLAKSMSQYLIDQLASRPNIAVELNTTVEEAAGDPCLEEIVTLNHVTGKLNQRMAYSLFVMIGATAHTEWLPATIARDKSGFLVTGQDLNVGVDWHQDRAPFALETSIPGVFAVGDVRHGSVKRVAAGVGEGSTAISFVHQVL